MGLFIERVRVLELVFNVLIVNFVVVLICLLLSLLLKVLIFLGWFLILLIWILNGLLGIWVLLKWMLIKWLLNFLGVKWIVKFLLLSLDIWVFFFFFEGVIIEVFMLLIFVFVWIEKEVGWFIFKLFFVRFDILRFWKWFLIFGDIIILNGFFGMFLFVNWMWIVYFLGVVGKYEMLYELFLLLVYLIFDLVGFLIVIVRFFGLVLCVYIVNFLGWFIIFFLSLGFVVIYLVVLFYIGVLMKILKGFLGIFFFFLFLNWI